LNAHGIDSINIPAKLEGIAFGPDLTVGGLTKHTLFVSNDNDYLATLTDSNHPNGVDNANRWFVFTVDASDLPNYVPQAIETNHSCSEDHRPWHDWFNGPWSSDR
jgi:hypothetical protein